MNRWLRGPVVLATAVGLWSCSGDPTDSFRGSASSIVSTPSSIFLSEGETKAVLVQALDEQGNTLPVTFELSGGAGVTVVKDTTFLPTNGSGPVEGTTRYLVTAGTPVGTSFVVSAEGVADTVEVRVTPLSFPGTFSNAAPAVNEPVTITATGGFTFAPDAGVVIGADTATVLSVAADGSTLTFIAPPGATGIPDVSGLNLDFLPGLPLSLPSTTTITVGTTVTPFVGTDAPATAPILPYPEPGTTTAFFDAAPFAATACGVANDGAPCQLYKITVPADGALDATLSYPNSTDLGLFVLSEDGTADTGQACDAGGNAEEGGLEACTITLVAGTYLVAIVNFGPFYDPVDPPPPYLFVALTPAVAE